MPPRMFRNVSFVAIVAIGSTGAMVYYSLTVLWPTIIGNLYTADSMQIGWQSSAVGGGMLLGQATAGFCISYVPKVKWQCVVMSAMAFAFSTSLTTISPDRWAATIALGTLLLVGKFNITACHHASLFFRLTDMFQPLASSRTSPCRASRLSGRHKTLVSQQAFWDLYAASRDPSRRPCTRPSWRASWTRTCPSTSCRLLPAPVSQTRRWSPSLPPSRPATFPLSQASHLRSFLQWVGRSRRHIRTRSGSSFTRPSRFVSFCC